MALEESAIPRDRGRLNILLNIYELILCILTKDNTTKVNITRQILHTTRSNNITIKGKKHNLPPQWVWERTHWEWGAHLWVWVSP